METLKWKIRIVVLWFIAAEAYSAHMIMVTIDPGPMKKMLEWGATINAEGWLFGVIYWLIPFWMAFVFYTARSLVSANCSSLTAFGYSSCGYSTDYLVCMEVA